MHPTLHHKLSAIQQAKQPGFFADLFPQAITQNLKMANQIRPYQQEALGRFAYYMEQGAPPQPTQLLFQMATGSGKTLVMAALILYLYQRGYRNFLFFVNSANIISKTKDNFLNPLSPKYLFAPVITIQGKPVVIKEVTNFQTADEQNINLLFTTIQGLHSNLNNPRENGIVAEDFEQQQLVLISDEAHHLNAETKKGKITDPQLLQELVSWEATVNRIFNANAQNLLLEFTATANLNITEIGKKYNHKLIFDYPLRQFRQEGYSKEVKVWQAQLPPFQRALQAVLLSQYRQKVFAKYGIAAKPVILFKSKTIAESRHFFELFTSGIQRLQVADLETLQNFHSNNIVQQVFSFLEQEKESIENLVSEIKENFAPAKLISVNSKEESEEKQIAVNTLEHPNNPYRAVFAVDKLNEGWDVLNLFDIVRLYDTRHTNAHQPAKTTIAEAQLIGRGARYFPFAFGNNTQIYKRKFDADLTHHLRICEELYYHSPYNPTYITELSAALQHTGIKAHFTAAIPITLSAGFTQTPRYQQGCIFTNQRLALPPQTLKTLPPYLLQKPITPALQTGVSQTDNLFNLPTTQTSATAKQQIIALNSIAPAILRKAINQLPFFQFSNLKSIFPDLISISEFMQSPYFLGGVSIALPAQTPTQTPQQWLHICAAALQEITQKLAKPAQSYQGSRQFTPALLRHVVNNKTLLLQSDNPINTHPTHQLPPTLTLPFYALEQDDGLHHPYTLQLVELCTMLTHHGFTQVQLLKNMGYATLYRLKNGDSVQPHYLLWATQGNQNYQIFIEICPPTATPPPLLYHQNTQVWQNQTHHIFWLQTTAAALCQQPQFNQNLLAVVCQPS